MDVRVFKLTNGEEFIAEVAEVNEEGVDFKHPVVLVSDGVGGHSFTPWIATAKQTEFWIKSGDIRFMEEAVDELDEAYTSMFGAKSAIVVPDSKIILG